MLRFIENGGFTYHNLERLRLDLMDLHYCLQVHKDKSSNGDSIQGYNLLQEDTTLALALVNMLQDHVLPVKDEIDATDYISSLYALLVSTYYDEKLF